MKLWLIFLSIPFVQSFLFPLSLLGQWSPTNLNKDGENIGHLIIHNNNASVYVNQGHLEMRLRESVVLDPQKIQCWYHDLQIKKIPNSINLNRMTKTIPIITHIKKYGLCTEIEILDPDSILIHYHSEGKFTGKIQMYKCKS